MHLGPSATQKVLVIDSGVSCTKTDSIDVLTAVSRCYVRLVLFTGVSDECNSDVVCQTPFHGLSVDWRNSIFFELSIGDNMYLID